LDSASLAFALLEILRDYAKANARQLGFSEDHAPIAAPSFHPMFRIGSQGNLIIDMVVELVDATFDVSNLVSRRNPCATRSTERTTAACGHESAYSAIRRG
jgi:hypothetical protein